MGWTTQAIHVDRETGEVLNKKVLHKYELINTQKIITKINDTHTERKFIYEYRRSRQTEIW